jgi:diguanylate cyclase (GGDEF)-like protein/PAS domain S-box-containing protein
MTFRARVVRAGRRSRALAVLLAMWAIGLLALAVVSRFQNASDDQRRAEVAVEQIRQLVAAAPGIPFNLGPGHTATRADVGAQLERSHRSITSAIERLRRIDDESTEPGLQLQTDRLFERLQRVFALAAARRFDEAGAELGRASRPGAPLYELQRALAARSARDRREADDARRRSLYASIGAVLLILVAFSIALEGARRQRRRVERLAAQNTELLDRSRREEERYRELFENATEPIATVDLEWRFTAVNRAFASALGYTPAELLGATLSDHLTPESRALGEIHRDRKLSGVAKAATYEQEFITRSGRIAIFEVSTRLIEEGGRPVGIQGMCRDITARKEAEAELRRLAVVNEHQAKHDALTGLPNRRLFQQEIDDALRAAHPDGDGFAVLVIDLDDFKQVNDSLGHQSGDALLAAMAHQLQLAVRAEDRVARLGGDEFGVLLDRVNRDDSDWIRVVDRIERALEQPVHVQDVPIAGAASIGIAFHPGHGSTAEQLLQRADVAMYVAKEARRGHAVYDAEEDRSDAGRLRVLGELKQALVNGELVIHYQPIVDLRTGRADRVEALVRWLHPERGLIPPDDFIPFAERTGLIKPLTLYVLDQAVRQCREWESAGHDFSIAVNLSSRNLSEPDLVDNVLRVLSAHRLDPTRLLLEVTESAIITDPIHTQDVLRRLSAAGVRIALDDFGAGYTSLAYLSRLSLDEVKIDRSFVESIADIDTFAIIRSIVHLGHELGHEIIAEGVESSIELAALRRLGCDHVQGAYFSRPQPPERLLEAIARLAAGRSTGVAAA